jgi:hypothetical protein
MELYTKGLYILNESRFLPLKVTELNKDLKNNTIIPKKFYLNNQSKNVMNNIKDIKIIIMDNDFNQKIKLPKGIKIITLGNKFNKKIKFPEGIEIINLGVNFNQIVEYPKSLKCLSISDTYSKEIILNDNIKEFYGYKKFPIILPVSLEERKKDGIILDFTKRGINVYRRSLYPGNHTEFIKF